ncbi:right-handed parallel beta-helix repeat-containing protein [Caenispirillum salinarum]|uniref:right-handed parallel beta-helix repeat-containing protein n=1 Tax=Caenispirillum salinarum TaxID=859058 RepID=UPI0038506525
MLSRRNLLLGGGAASALFLVPVDSRAKNNLLVTDFGAAPDPGRDNLSAFQAALEHAAEIGGGTVHVPEGVWHIKFDRKVNSLKIPSNVTLKGAGQDTIISVMQQTEDRTHVFTNANWKKGNSNIAISDVTIRCNGFGWQEGSRDARINGVTFWNVANSSVERVSVTEGHGYGIWLTGKSARCVVKQCSVTDFGDYIELSNGATNNLIVDNTCLSTGAYHFSSNGILLYKDADHNIVARNTVTGGYGSAISTVSGYGPANSNLIAQNTIDADRAVGIYLAGHNNKILSNDIKALYNCCILFDKGEYSPRRTVIEKNNIHADLTHSPTEERKAALASFSRAENTVLLDNRITALNGDGARISGRNWSIVSNEIVVESDHQHAGIQTLEHSNGMLTDNTIMAPNPMLLHENSAFLIDP